ncbi:MAG: hypothetical protein GY895_15070 [Phycisphaera sp.]|nr:hypothetical protein [Phycisphaera sp.]
MSAIELPIRLFGAGAPIIPSLGIMLTVGGRIDRFPKTTGGVMIAEVSFSI